MYIRTYISNTPLAFTLIEKELELFVGENGNNDFGLGLKGTKQAKI